MAAPDTPYMRFSIAQVQKSCPRTVGTKVLENQAPAPFGPARLSLARGRLRLESARGRHLTYVVSKSPPSGLGTYVVSKSPPSAK